MSGIFPAAADGGLAPDAGHPDNPTHAYPPATVPADTLALYYGNGCEVRLRPEVLNSLISEIARACDSAQVAYKASDLKNLDYAIRYLIQRGLPKYANLVGGPADYTCQLDPTATGYNNGMTLCVVPNVPNIGPVTLNVDGKGPMPIYRSDGTTMKDGDFIAAHPFLISFYGGAWYIIGITRAQGPQIMTSNVDGWIRTDGNDDTGDGTSNDPQHAFKTINGAWSKLGPRYIASPMFSINLRLGIPGIYAGGQLRTFGGLVSIIGDQSNAYNYVIQSALVDPDGGNTLMALYLASIACACYGVNFRNTAGPPSAAWAVHASGNTRMWLSDCVFEQAVNNPASRLLDIGGGSPVAFMRTLQWLGNNTNIDAAVAVSGGSSAGTASLAIPVTHTFNNLIFNNAGIAAFDLGLFSIPATTLNQSNCHGARYRVSNNSIINAVGCTLPGDAAGAVTSGGQYNP